MLLDAIYSVFDLVLDFPQVGIGLMAIGAALAVFYVEG